MKARLILLAVIFCSSVSYGQEKYEYVFEKLVAVDTIRSKATIDSLQKNAELYERNFLVVYYENVEIERRLCLIRPEMEYWIVWQLEEPDVRSHSRIIGQSNSKQFLFVNLIRSDIARQTEWNSKDLQIIDVKNGKGLNVSYYSSMRYWDSADTDGIPVSEYEVNSSKISLTRDGFLVLTNHFSLAIQRVSDVNLIPSGEYEINQSGLRRITFYDEKLMQFRPIKFMNQDTEE